MKTILLVEDNPSDVALTQRALNKANITNPLVVAEDGAEALDYLWCRGKYENRESNELPVVVLLDLKLPLMDGIEVLRQIRANEHTCYVPVVMLTTSKEEQDLLGSYKLGANSYIRKPVDFNQFADAIKQIGLYWLVLNENPPTK